MMKKPEVSELTADIVRATDPEKVVLFGDFAKGAVKPESHIAFCVVVSDGRNIHDEGRAANHIPWDYDESRDVDILMKTETEFRRDRIARSDLFRNGKVVYGRAS